MGMVWKWRLPNSFAPENRYYRVTFRLHHQQERAGYSSVKLYLPIRKQLFLACYDCDVCLAKLAFDSFYFIRGCGTRDFLLSQFFIQPFLGSVYKTDKRIVLGSVFPEGIKLEFLTFIPPTFSSLITPKAVTYRIHVSPNLPYFCGFMCCESFCNHHDALERISCFLREISDSFSC